MSTIGTMNNFGMKLSKNATKFCHHNKGMQQSTNQIKLPHRDNAWKPIIRDIFMAFIPLFVIYKILTHPMIAKLGYQDPHAPKKRSQREMLEQSLYTLSLKRRQEELHKENFFLEAMDEDKCYDTPTINIYAQLQPQKGRRPFNRPKSPRKSLPHRQATIGKQSLGKLLSKLYGKVSRHTISSVGERKPLLGGGGS